MDDGDATRGAMMALAAASSTAASTAATPNPPAAVAYSDAGSYTVCMSL
jgi:hypothetical protein